MTLTSRARSKQVNAAPLRSPVVVPAVALFVLTLAGRFGLERLGSQWPVPIPERTIAATVLVMLCAGSLARGGASDSHPVGRRQLRLVLFLLGYLCISVLWRPPLPSPTLQPNLFWDVVTVALSCVVMGLCLRADTHQTVRVWLWCTFVSGLVFAFAGIASGADRASAFGGGPNVFGRTTALALVACLGLVYGYAAKRVILLGAPVLVLATVLSGSRGAMLTLLVGFAVILVPFLRRLRFRDMAPFLLVAAVAAFAWGRLGSVVASVFELRFVELTFEQSHDSGRSPLYAAAWQMLLDRPVTGWGLGGFEASYGIFHAETYPHNIFLQLGAEGGLVALGLFVVSLVIALSRRAKTFPARTALALTLASLTSAQTSGDYFDSRHIFLSLLLCATLYDADAEPAHEDESALTPAQRRRAVIATRSGVRSGARRPAQRRPIQVSRAPRRGRRAPTRRGRVT